MGDTMDKNNTKTSREMNEHEMAETRGKTQKNEGTESMKEQAGVRDEDIQGFIGEFEGRQGTVRITDCVVRDGDGWKAKKIDFDRFCQFNKINGAIKNLIRMDRFRRNENDQPKKGLIYLNRDVTYMNYPELDPDPSQYHVPMQSAYYLMEKSLFEEYCKQYGGRILPDAAHDTPNFQYFEIITSKYKSQSMKIMVGGKTHTFYSLPNIGEDISKIIKQYINHKGLTVDDNYGREIVAYIGGFFGDKINYEVIKEKYQEVSRKEMFELNPNRVSDHGLDKEYLSVNDHLFKISHNNEYIQLISICSELTTDLGTGRRKYLYNDNRLGEKALSQEDVKRLIELYFQYYSSKNKLFKNPLTASEAETRQLLNSINYYLPKNCDKNIILEWLKDRMATNKVLGIEKDPFFGNYEEEDPAEKDNTEEELFEFYQKQSRSVLPENNKSAEEEEERRRIYNQMMNLYCTISQNFITVVTGKPGSGKGALCDLIGKGLEYKDEQGALRSRYLSMSSYRTWSDRHVFEKQFTDPDGRFHAVSKYLNYEAEQPQAVVDLPYLISIKDATSAPVDEYFEDFINISKRWYRSTDAAYMGDTELKISKTVRFVLEASYEENGLLSTDLLGLISVIDYNDKDMVTNIIDYMNEHKNLSILSCFRKVKPAYGPELHIEERWGGIDENVYEKLYNEFADLIQRYVRINGKKINLETNRTRNAVSRYWVKAGEWLIDEYYSYEEQYKEEVKNRYCPEGIIIDEDCLDYSRETGMNKGATYVKTRKRLEVKKETVALDYALSQRVLPFATLTKGKVTIDHVSDIVEYLLKNGFFHTAGLLKAAIEEERILIRDELSEVSNNEFIIKKCERIYNRLLTNDGVIIDGAEDSAKETDPEDVIDRICRSVNLYRDKNTYTRNVIVNMLICLTQGFLTVYSGKPGCGKTSICKILGRTLGLTDSDGSKQTFQGYEEFRDRRNDIVKTDRYIEVSTERGWTSKRDFIGYYNPLTEQFDKTNAVLYNAFLVMDEEARVTAERRHAGEKTKNLPCLILLDEANLSPMEYYWADFMNLCEEWTESNSIDLGGGKVFRIAEGLHFIATINNDHTTEVLSPRLIDRANVIDLPVPGNQIADLETDEAEIRPISWEELKAVFGCSENDAISLKAEEEDSGDTAEKSDMTELANYNTIKEYVQEHFSIMISPRTDLAVSRYWTRAKELFEEEHFMMDENDDLKERFDQISDAIKDGKGISDLRMSDEDCVELIGKYITYSTISKERWEKSENASDVEAVVQAMDYAIAQRVLPKITDISGEDALQALTELWVILIDNQYYKSAGIVADMVKRGKDTGFYNYFR